MQINLLAMIKITGPLNSSSIEIVVTCIHMEMRVQAVVLVVALLLINCLETSQGFCSHGHCQGSRVPAIRWSWARGLQSLPPAAPRRDVVSPVQKLMTLGTYRQRHTRGTVSFPCTGACLICAHHPILAFELRDACLRTADCSTDLFCSTCIANGDALRRCHRYRATNTTAIRGGLPFNRYAWLTTHNAFAIVGEPSHTSEARITFYNQEDSVTDQLNNGVRGLMLDMYDFLGDIWLCHSFGGVCYNFTAFEPAINTLKEVEVFLSVNPTEIVTIFIEDYVKSTKGLTKVFTAAGLLKYWFPVSSMPKNGEDWPTVTDMIARNYRLLVFTSNRTKEASEGIAYNWRYVNENQYGNGGMKEGECVKRAESAALNASSRSLVLLNFFRDDPVQAKACKYNSAPLQSMLPVCYEAAGKRWANYLAVDFYKRSDGGGTLAALDTLNGGLICGCSNINVCKLNFPYGVCNSSSSIEAARELPQNVQSQGNKHSRKLQALLPSILASMSIYLVLKLNS